MPRSRLAAVDVIVGGLKIARSRLAAVDVIVGGVKIAAEVGQPPW